MQPCLPTDSCADACIRLAGAKAIPDESRLVLYALHQQATLGPCTEPKPWAWNVVESAKWQSWVQLGEMSSVEAMRLYVKLLDEEIQVRYRLVCVLLAMCWCPAALLETARPRSPTGGRRRRRRASLRQPSTRRSTAPRRRRGGRRR